MFRVVFLIALFSTIVVLPCSTSAEVPITFVKTDRTFARTLQYEASISPDSFSKHIPDYITVTQTLLDMLIKDNSTVKAQYLNKFNLGLHQFYLSLAYELHYRRTLYQYPKSKSHFNDPVPMPNGTAIGLPDLYFHGVRAYGFPGFKKWIHQSDTEKNDPYLQYCKTRRIFSSDVMIFTGHFVVFQKNSFFVYYTKNNTLDSKKIKFRSNKGTIEPNRKKDSLHFELESLTHTYDSDWKKYRLVNETLYKKLISVMEQIWLPELMSMTEKKLYPDTIRDSSTFAGIYRLKVLDSLIDSAKHFILMTSPSDTFESSSINFTTISRQGIKFVQTYQDQKVEGLLNFDRYYHNETKIINYLDSSPVLSETVSFSYSNRSSAFVSFTIVDSHGPSVKKKYSVSRMNITCVFNVDTLETSTDKPSFKVHRKKDAFWNGSGFQVLFDLVDFDPALQFVVYHMGNDIARIIARTLDAETDIFNADFE